MNRSKIPRIHIRVRNPYSAFLFNERYEIHESISLAFLMALQQLPGRQRAVLILRDVMGWKAQEVSLLCHTDFFDFGRFYAV